MKRLPFAGIAVVAAAAAFALAPLPATVVERIYAARIYPPIQRSLTTVSNRAPFALVDVLLAGVVVALLALTVRDIASAGWRRGFTRFIWRAISWGSIAYLVFLIVWGLNYRRLPMDKRLPYEEASVNDEGAKRLTLAAVDRLNALHATAHASGWPPAHVVDPVLAQAFERAIQRLGVAEPVTGRPKPTLLTWYFERAGVSGMVDPFFLETLLAGDLLPFERPFVVAHEWSHLAGLADEGEANLAGWMACLGGSPSDQYSGWLFMFTELANSFPPADRRGIGGMLADGPRADLRAIRERVTRHVSPRISSAGWRVYDSYLKANRVEAGAASYQQVVRLALGLRAAAPLESLTANPSSGRE